LKIFIVYLLPIILEIKNLNRIKMTKKLLILILVFAVMLIFSSCKKPDEQQKFTDEQIAAFCQEIKVVADAMLHSENPDWNSLVKQYKDREEIKKIEANHNGMMIEFVNGEIRGWLIPPESLKINWDKGKMMNVANGMKTHFDSKDKPKMLIVHTCYHENRPDANECIAELKAAFENSWDVTIKDKETNVEFFKKELAGYDLVFIIAHGSAVLDKTWITTSEPASNNTGGAIVYLPGQVATGSSGYYLVSHTVINDNYSSNSFPNSMVYLVCCQGLKYPTHLGKAFIDKGAKVVVGWNETNCLGAYSGCFLLQDLLIENFTLNEGINLLKTKTMSFASGWVVTDFTHDYHNPPSSHEARLVFYPPTAGTYKLPTGTPESSLKITSPSYGTIYHCGEWVDIFVSGYIGSDWQEYLELWVSCLVGEPQHIINDEPNLYKGKAYTRAEEAYSFTFSPETPSVWDGRWVKLIAHNKKDNIWSASQYIKVSPIDNEEGVVINGIRWATRNVDMPGTFAAKPEDAGMFYQWNRKIGWSSTDPMINSSGGNTWDASSPTGDSWEKANDPSPLGYRVPTDAEFKTLFNTTFVTNVWTTENGVPGRRFTDIATNNSFFLPATGARINTDGTLNYVGTNGYYWSSTSTMGHAWCLNFDDSSTHVYGYYKTPGLSVRPVAE